MVSKRWFAESLKTRWVRWGAEPMGWRRTVTVRGGVSAGWWGRMETRGGVNEG